MERKLYKSQNDKVLSGVCGGIGEYFAVDSVIVRLLWVVFTLMGGAGLIAYIIAAIIIPQSPFEVSRRGEYPGGYERDERESGDYYHPEEYDNGAGRARGNGAVTLGVLFLLMGGFVLLRNFIPQIPDELFLALFLIGLGVFFISRRTRP